MTLGFDNYVMILCPLFQQSYFHVIYYSILILPLFFWLLGQNLLILEIIILFSSPAIFPCYINYIVILHILYVLYCNIKTVSNAAIHMISYKRSVADINFMGYTIGLRGTVHAWESTQAKFGKINCRMEECKRLFKRIQVYR